MRAERVLTGAGGSASARPALTGAAATPSACAAPRGEHGALGTGLGGSGAIGEAPVRRASPAERTARVSSAGGLAHAALVRSGGQTQPVPGFAATGFRLAAGELIWVGGAAPLHPRVVVLTPGEAGARLDLAGARIHPARALPGLGARPARGANTTSIAVRRMLHRCEPGGFAAVLAGRCPAFPLDHRADAARALAAACARDHAHAFVAAAALLLGTGCGLTPSGDDLVGGALFARRLAGMSPAWRDAAGAIVALAPARTHAISCALLADLAAGSSYAALHDMADAIAATEPACRLALRMQTLVGIGHSSGWDMLAGFVAGLAGTLDSCAG